MPKEDVDTHDDLTNVFEQLELELGSDVTAKEIAAQLNDPNPDQAIAPGVHLLNAHTGKGQQFDWVFVPGFESFNVPSPQAKTPSELAKRSGPFL